MVSLSGSEKNGRNQGKYSTILAGVVDVTKKSPSYPKIFPRQNHPPNIAA
jgi:hypothetical protein